MITRETPLRLAAVLCCALLAILPGCRKGRPECIRVAGKVLIDGAPLKTGIVRVVPLKDRHAEGQIGPNGEFRLTTFIDGDGCVKGTHAVEVVGCEKAGSNGIRWLAPSKYATTATSGLQVTIDKPTDNLVLQLTWEGGKPIVEKFDASGDFDPTKVHGKAAAGK